MNAKAKTWNEYQAWVGRKCNTDLACSVMGLAGEAAEVDEHADARSLMRQAGTVVDMLKKVLFHGKPLDSKKLEGELGDVLFYLTDIARQNGLTLRGVMQNNVDKLDARYPDGFSIEAAQQAELLKAADAAKTHETALALAAGDEDPQKMHDAALVNFARTL